MEKDGFSVQLQRVVKTQGVVLAIVKCSKNLGFLPAYMEHIKGGAQKLTKLAPHFLHNLSSYKHARRLGHISFERWDP